MVTIKTPISKAKQQQLETYSQEYGVDIEVQRGRDGKPVYILYDPQYYTSVEDMRDDLAQQYGSVPKRLTAVQQRLARM